VTIGSLQITLRRLEDKGFLKSRLGESNEVRRGRPKLYFEITAYGKKAIEYAKQTRDDLWKSLPKLVLKLK
jgi:PadR family transcriptional regulator PadR